MYARIAQFEGDQATIDKMIAGVRENMESGGEMPEGLKSIQRVLMLTDLDGSKVTSLVFCGSEDDLRRADAALNEMSPDGGARRTAVELLKVAIDRTN